MSTAKYTSPTLRSGGNFASTAFNSLANNTESATVTYDNSTNGSLYAAVTLKLGSITPSSGGSVSLRVTISDGTDVSDKIGGDLYVMPLTSGASAKNIILPFVRLYPFSLRFSLVNNSGVSLASSGNEIYVSYYNEDIA
jgi:hypothetical protein